MNVTVTATCSNCGTTLPPCAGSLGALTDRLEEHLSGCYRERGRLAEVIKQNAGAVETKYGWEKANELTHRLGARFAKEHAPQLAEAMWPQVLQAIDQGRAEAAQRAEEREAAERVAQALVAFLTAAMRNLRPATPVLPPIHISMPQQPAPQITVEVPPSAAPTIKNVINMPEPVAKEIVIRRERDGSIKGEVRPAE